MFPASNRHTAAHTGTHKSHEHQKKKDSGHKNKNTLQILCGQPTVLSNGRILCDEIIDFLRVFFDLIHGCNDSTSIIVGMDGMFLSFCGMVLVLFDLSVEGEGKKTRRWNRTS